MRRALLFILSEAGLDLGAHLPALRTLQVLYRVLRNVDGPPGA